MSSYLPQSDAELLAWAQNFTSLLTSAPTDYGLTAPEAAVVQAALDEFQVAYNLAVTPSTRTKGTVQTKNIKKEALLGEIRPVAMQIKADEAVTDEKKINLGLHIDDTVPTPIGPPTTEPIVSVLMATALQHLLRFSDSTTPDKRAKPFGATGLQLFRAVGAVAPVTPEKCAFLSFVTRNPYISEFASEDAGKVASYFARWQNAKGQVGPWSTLVQYVVA